MIRLIITMLFVLTTTVAFAADATTGDTNFYSIDSREFEGLEKCNISINLKETLNRLMASAKPVKKEESAWTYQINAEVFGFPAHELQIGVCDISGERSCGWGSFIAIVLAKPLEEVKKHLIEKLGTDFTKEEREKEFNVTLRPVLAKGKKVSESVLFCDPGNL